MNIFSFITVSGTYTLQAGWSSVLIVPDGAVQIVNNASPPESLTIEAPLKLGNGINLYSQLVINGNAELIINGDSVVSNHIVPGSATWGAIGGNPVNQSDIQNGTIQGTFTPSNTVVAENDTFKTAFEKLQGQISNRINKTTNTYIFVANGTSATDNGTALIAAVTAAKALTPSGSALSSTNRAVVWSIAGSWDLGSSSILLENYVDIIFVGDAKDNIITSANATGTIQVGNSNDYILKNCSIVNSGIGGSIVHNASQTDNGEWENVILNAPNTPGTTFAGAYKNITGISDGILNGNISGVVQNSSFQNMSCGYSPSIVTISGLIEGCRGLTNCFGASINDIVTISGIIRNCIGQDNCFGCSPGWVTIITGLIESCQATANSFGYSGINLSISGIIRDCEGTTNCFGSNTASDLFISGSIIDCIATSQSFGYSSGSNTGFGVTISGDIYNCLGTSNCFGSADLGAFVTISGIVENCSALIESFGHSTSVSTISGMIKNCTGTASCFGSTTVTGKIINCTRNSGYGTHLGIIEYCTFSDDSAGSAITLGSGATVRYSTVYQAGAGECFDGAATTDVKVYQCSANKVLSINLNNLIIIPYNVIDTDVSA